MAQGGIPLGVWSGSDATDRLRESIEQASAESARQTRMMLRLTWAIAALTAVMLVGVCVQVWLAWIALPK